MCLPYRARLPSKHQNFAPAPERIVVWLVSIRRVRRPQASRYRSVSISQSTGTLSHLHVSCLVPLALLTRPDASVICCSYLHIVAFGDCRVSLPCCTALLGVHDKRCCSYGIYSISTTYDGALKSCDHNFNLRRCFNRRVSVSLLLFLILILLCESAISPLSIDFFFVLFDSITATGV